MTDHWFWKWVDQSGGPDACWPWMRGTFTDGYGQLKVDGKGKRANRVALELALGRPIGDGLVARHECRNILCCNPAHLSEGTVLENIHDERRHGTMPIKLTEKDIPVIRAAVAEGESQSALARRYGVDPSMISRVARGQRWSHV